MTFRPLPPEVRQSVVDDLKSGKYGRNEIARRNYVGNATVTRIAEEEGLDPSAKSRVTQSATRAVAVETKARRERLKAELLGDVERLRVRAWSEWTKEVLTRTGKKTTLRAELPPLPEVQAAYRSIGIALDSFFKLEALDTTGSTTQDARDFLMDLRDQLGKVREEFEQGTGVAFDSDEARQIIAGEVVNPGTDEVP